MRYAFPLIAASAALLAADYAAAQAKSDPSVEKYLCVYAGKCDGAGAAPDATMRAPDGKGFRIAKSPSEPAKAATPAPVAAKGIARPVARVVRHVAATQARRSDLSIAFGLGSDRMTADGVAKARIFAIALQRPELSQKRFLIEGHTDSLGSASSNRDLSQRRAQAVADFLAAQGVARERLDVKGMGFDAPIAGHRASDPVNRRVEAELIS